MVALVASAWPHSDAIRRLERPPRKRRTGGIVEAEIEGPFTRQQR